MRYLFFILFLSNICLSQTRRVIIQPVSSDMSLNIRTTISDQNAKIIEIERPGGGDIKVSGLIDFKGKVLSLSTGTKIIGTVIIANVVIKAGKEQQLFTSDVTLQNVRSDNGVFYSRWFGANGEDTEPDEVAIQKGLDYVINNDVGAKVFEFSPGTYRLNKGLVIWRDSDNDGNPEQVNITIRGTIGAIMGTSNETTLLCQYENGFGIAWQRGKGIRIENINIIGPNQLNYSITQALDPASSYLINSTIRTNSQSPSVGVAGDFAGASTTGTDRYPGFESYYDRIQGNGGSTDCRLYNVTISGFVAGIILTPNNNTQNNEAHVFENIWISNCRDGFVTTNSQERTVQCRNFKFWNSVKTCFRTNGYGMNRGEVPQIESTNAAGVFELFNFSGSGGYFPVVSINNVYAENFYWIGNINAITVQFNGCHFAFAIPKNLGQKNQDFLALGSNMFFNNCILISYGDSRVPYNIRSRTKFVNCFLQNPVCYRSANWTNDFYEIEYENCSFYSENGFISNGSFESKDNGYINITYGSQVELATYNKEYASFKNNYFSQYRKVKTPLVRKTLVASNYSVTVTGNKAICSVLLAPKTIIYTMLFANGEYGFACMTSTDIPFEFDHVINSMVSGNYDLYSISLGTISTVGFVFKGRITMERGTDGGASNEADGTIICNYEYEEYGFSSQNPLTNINVPVGVAFTKGSIYTNRTGSAGTSWICTKSGVKGSIASPEFKQLN